MNKPDKITAEDQKRVWTQFELQVQEFRSNKEQRDSEFKAELEKLHSRLRRIKKAT